MGNGRVREVEESGEREETGGHRKKLVHTTMSEILKIGLL